MASRTRPLLSRAWDSKKGRIATVFGFTLAGLAFVKDTMLDIHRVHGPSMSPTLSPFAHETGQSDHILTVKRNLRGTPVDRDGAVSFEKTRPARATLQRGDVVTFWQPHNPERIGVKRVIGVPGDTIVRNVKRVGRQKENEGRVGGRMGMEVPPLVVKVPRGHIWVEGDNWRNTVDSNDYGTIPISLVTARVVGIVWPPSRIGAIPPLRVNDAAIGTSIPGGRKTETLPEMDALI
ncbi:signal peptidase I [Venturia nashicola]|nr:signal peptidase I [Venturia nashicola]